MSKELYELTDRDVIISINHVEPGLVKALKRHSEELGRELKGVVVVDNGYASRSKNYGDKSGTFEEVFVDFDDEEALQVALLPYQLRTLVVTCRKEDSIPFLAKAVPFLPYAHTATTESLKWATEKNHMRDRLRAFAPDLVPKYVVSTKYTPTLAAETVEKFGLPLIIKPSGLAASVLVKKCFSVEELDESLAQTFAKIEEVYERDKGRGEPKVLIEEVMEGDMFSIDAYVDHLGNVYCLPLIHVTTAFAAGFEGFYSYRHDTHFDMSDEVRQAAVKATEAAARGLYLNSSSAHVELMLTDEGWKIIELGPRMGGYREDLYREAFGVDHHYNDLAIRMGRVPEIKSEEISCASGLNIYAETEGLIKAVEGLAEAQQVESVVYLKQHKFPGDEAIFAGNGGKFIIDGIMSNTSYDKLDADNAKVRELIQFEVEEKTVEALSTASVDNVQVA